RQPLVDLEAGRVDAVADGNPGTAAPGTGRRLRDGLHQVVQQLPDVAAFVDLAGVVVGPILLVGRALDRRAGLIHRSGDAARRFLRPVDFRGEDVLAVRPGQLEIVAGAVREHAVQRDAVARLAGLAA